tara:strand:+ start:3271 stop:3528 length:258 start_codon:yes stop_codon:yes gene_type:complete
MAKTKKVVKAAITKKLEINEKYVVGDLCYFLNHYNKILLGEVHKVHESEDAYTIIEQTQYKFNIVEHIFCRDSQKALKGVKRPKK